MKTDLIHPCARLGVASLEAWALPALIAAPNLLPAGRVTAQTFTTLHSFTATADNGNFSSTKSDGAAPYYAGLSFSGNTLYGTAYNGGSSGNGTLFRLSFRPQLTITPSETNVILSWPTNVAGFDYSGYALQSAPALTGTFTNLPAATNPYTNPISGPQQFYRLIAN